MNDNMKLFWQMLATSFVSIIFIKVLRRMKQYEINQNHNNEITNNPVDQAPLHHAPIEANQPIRNDMTHDTNAQIIREVTEAAESRMRPS